jgi:hypothetical protein
VCLAENQQISNLIVFGFTRPRLEFKLVNLWCTVVDFGVYLRIPVNLWSTVVDFELEPRSGETKDY